MTTYLSDYILSDYMYIFKYLFKTNKTELHKLSVIICYNQLIFRGSSGIIVLLDTVLLNTTTNYFSLANIYLKINRV